MTDLTTPNLGLPYPDQNENVDVPTDLSKLALAIDVLNFVPVGVLLMWPGGAAPAGWLLCQGQTVPAASYPGLAALLGATGGNVTLPDYRDLFPVGASTGKPLGSTGGLDSVTLTGAQSGINGNGRAANVGTGVGVTGSGGHEHNYTKRDTNQGVGGGGGVGSDIYEGTYTTFGGGGHSHGISDPGHGHPLTARNADAAHENKPPYRAINFIIKAG
jgi:microcystin-dependent protein